MILQFAEEFTRRAALGGLPLRHKFAEWCALRLQDVDFLATLSDALRRRILEGYRLPDWETRPPRRPLYVASELDQWIDGTPELLVEKVGPRLLIEHLEQLLCDFRCSERPPAADIRRMKPTPRGILSAHAPGLRIYGWCCEPGRFIAIDAALERETKSDKTLNDRKRDNVLAFAKTNGLEGLIMKGEIYELFPPDC
jgi:hypothetical protein